MALPYLAAALSTLWIFRTVVRGQMLGDIGDARWTVALHEHWYQFWQGNESLRNLDYYYPLANTLGTSDAFLVQGQIYSVARLFGVGLVNSWATAQFVFFLIGALGVAFLSGSLFFSVWVRSAFVVLTCAGYPILASVTHVQLFGFLAASWIVVGAIDLASGRSPGRGLLLLAVVPPVLALSSWYAVVLVFLVGGIYLVFLFFIKPWSATAAAVRATVFAIGRSLRRPVGWIALLGGGVGWALVLYIYLPSRGLLPAPGWDEVVLYSPRWSDIVNGYWAGGGLWAPLYERLYAADAINNEQVYGFTPVVLVCLLIAAAVQLKGLTSRHANDAPAPSLPRPGPGEVFAAFLTICAAIAFFLVDERGNGAFRLFWEQVPGLESIRSPYRVQIFGYALAFFVILRAFELWVIRQRARVNTSQIRIRLGYVAIACLMAVCFLEMQRVVVARWQAAELVSPGLIAQELTVEQQCDAAIVLDPSKPDWLNSIDGVLFSAETGVPTPQGYSRQNPIGNPGLTEGPDALARWMRDQGFSGRVCTVTPTAVEQLAPQG